MIGGVHKAMHASRKIRSGHSSPLLNEVSATPGTRVAAAAAGDWVAAAAAGVPPKPAFCTGERSGPMCCLDWQAFLLRAVVKLSGRELVQHNQKSKRINTEIAV